MEEPSALIGHRIGAYEVARLDRDVALKVVRPSLAADPELMMRLEREARVLATLSHPHIAAIYQIELGADVVMYDGLLSP
jgi:serine/threonine protein kinase